MVRLHYAVCLMELTYMYAIWLPSDAIDLGRQWLMQWFVVWRSQVVCGIHLGATSQTIRNIPDSKVHVAHIGPTWVLSAPGGPHIGPMNLAIRDVFGDITFLKFQSHLPGPMSFKLTLNSWRSIQIILAGTVRWVSEPTDWGCRW